jgi:DNA-binding response OmpR family regulator
MEKTRGQILSVDDDADTREMLIALFEVDGYEVSVTGSISEAVAMALEHRFDLFLLDWVLKDGTGIELCSALRSMEVTAPILFYAGLDLTSEQMNEAMTAGAQGFITKPIDISGVLQRVSDLTNQPKPSH